MHSSNDRSDSNEIADDVPVADAVEQEQETALEPLAPDPPEPPLEAAGPDWHEQRQEVVGADDDREDYPE